MNVFKLFWLRRPLMPFELVILISLVIKYRTIVGSLNTEPVFYRIYTGHAVDREHGGYMSVREGESPARECVQPYLPVSSDEVRKLQLPCEPPSCGNQEDWVYTKHGRFYISEEIEKRLVRYTVSIQPSCRILMTPTKFLKSLIQCWMGVNWNRMF